MKNEYKRAMNRVKADGEFRAALLETLADAQAKPRRTHFVRSRQFVMLLASAAVVALLVFSSVAVILPRIDREQTENHSVSKIDAPHYTEADSDNGADPDRYVGVGALNSVDPSEPYHLVSYAGQDYGNSSDGSLGFSKTLHFAFSGFSDYGVGLMSNDVVLDTAIDEDYTVSDLFNDYYGVISGGNGSYSSSNGVVDSFFDIPASSLREIDVYADGIEIINLNNVRLSDINDDEVFILVSVG